MKIPETVSPDWLRERAHLVRANGDESCARHLELAADVIEQQTAEIERKQSQLSLASAWNNAIIKMAGLEAEWADGGVSVSQVADALRSTVQPKI